MKDMVTMTKDEWMAKGTALFGDDFMKWSFRCPSCGHVQAVEDFKGYKDKGATPDTARFSCIGRYDGHGDTPMMSGNSPCNYTAGGLIRLGPVRVLDGDEELWSFAFEPVGA